MTPVSPGSTIGIIGGGQLGRMLSMAAAQIGYRCHVYAPEPSGPAADVSAKWIQGDYGDAEKLLKFARDVSVVTFEFENIDPAPLRPLAEAKPLFPRSGPSKLGRTGVLKNALPPNREVGRRRGILSTAGPISMQRLPRSELPPS